MANPMTKVRLEAVIDEAEDIKTFVLVPASGGDLPPFTPGAHIDVVACPGLVRQYSLCNPSVADPGRYEIAVKLERTGRGGSRAMHQLSAGAMLEIGSPRNNFMLEAAPHYVLMGGGIGVTPLLCMARHLSSSGASFELHYFTRSRAHTAFLTALTTAPLMGHAHLHQGLGVGETARVTEALLARPAPEARLYVCGPGPFMDLVVSKGDQFGTAAVHLERFSAPERPKSDGDARFTVRLARAGLSVLVLPGVSIAEALQQQGIEVPTSCEQGICGTCETTVLEGLPDHRDSYFSAAERASCRKILPCVSRSHSSEILLDL